MKRIVFTLGIAMMAIAAYGQDNNEKPVNDRFLDAKIREYVYQLELSDEQKAQFVPIYKRYSEEMHSNMQRHGKNAKSGEKELTSEDAVKIVKGRIERQQKAQAVRLKYVDEFATVLEPKQLLKLFEIENGIQQKVMMRKGGQHQGGQYQGGQRPQWGGQRPDGGQRPQGGERPQRGQRPQGGQKTEL